MPAERSRNPKQNRPEQERDHHDSQRDPQPEQPVFDPQDASLLDWQRAIGNQGIQRALAQGALKTRRSGDVIQAKLTVGAPDDVYEQEADDVAQSVMGMPDAAVQREALPEEEELQMKRVQRAELPEEEELQMKRIQREALPEEEELQMKRVQRAELPEEEELQMKRVQRAELPEEEELQMKRIQRAELPEEEELQMKRIQRDAVGGVPEVTEDIEGSIEGQRGGGQGMPDSAREFFEPRFGQDFSGVQIHTGKEADTLNRQLDARAFTTGSDIFFRDGEYNPESSGGRELLAHELTHVVQQGGDQDVSRKVEDRLQRLIIPVPGAGAGIRIGAADDSTVTINPEAVYFVGGAETTKIAFGPGDQIVNMTLSPGTEGILQMRFKVHIFVDNSLPFTNVEFDKWAFTEWPVKVTNAGELKISDGLPVRYSGDDVASQLSLTGVDLTKGENFVNARISIGNSTQYSRTVGAGYQGGVSIGAGNPPPRDFRVNITVPKPEVQGGSYMAYFKPASSQIDEGGEQAIIDWYKGLSPALQEKIQSGAAPITLVGRASTTQPGSKNRELSRARAEKVEQILRDYAGSDAKFKIFARGEYDATTPDNVEADSERVVEVSVSG